MRIHKNLKSAVYYATTHKQPLIVCKTTCYTDSGKNQAISFISHAEVESEYHPMHAVCNLSSKIAECERVDGYVVNHDKDRFYSCSYAEAQALSAKERKEKYGKLAYSV